MRAIRLLVVGLGVSAATLVVTGSPASAEEDPVSTAVTSFSDHWQKYHKGRSLVEEPGRLIADPAEYVAIHNEMLEHMLSRSR